MFMAFASAGAIWRSPAKRTMNFADVRINKRTLNFANVRINKRPLTRLNVGVHEHGISTIGVNLRNLRFYAGPKN
jgi:hypothetical protein